MALILLAMFLTDQYGTSVLLKVMLMEQTLIVILLAEILNLWKRLVSCGTNRK